MPKQKSIKLNFVMNAILAMSSFIFPLITFPYISRVLGPDGTGKVTFATSFVWYFNMIAQLGIPTYGIRACAEVRDDKTALTKTAHELLIINAFMNIIAYTALAISLKHITKLQDDKLLYIIISTTIVLSSIGMEWLYKALEQYTYITIRSLVFKIVAVVSMFFLVRSEADYIQYGVVSIIASSASNICNLINAHKYIGFKPVGNYNIRRHFKPIGVFFAMACATSIYTTIDSVMLGFMATDADVGFYHAATKVKSILVSIVTSLGTVLLPRASYYVQKGEIKEFRRITKKAINFVFLFASPLAVYFILYAKHGILLLSGNAFVGAIVPMQIIMPTLLIIGLSNIMGIQILVPTGREKIVLYSEIFGAGVNVLVNGILIPRLVSSGAAIGTLIAEFVVLLVQYHYLKNELSDVLKDIHYGKIVLGIGLGTVFSLWVLTLEMHSLSILIVTSVLFFGAYTAYMLFTKEELVVDLYDQICKKIRRKAGIN